MKSVLALFVSLFSTVALAHPGHQHPSDMYHLKYKGGTVHIHATFESAPETGKEAVLRLELKDGKTHQNIDIDDQIEVVLWMPDMGHGSAPTQLQRVLDANGNVAVGTYRATNMWFVMGGRWEVQVHMRGDAGDEVQTFEVNIEGGHGGGHH